MVRSFRHGKSPVTEDDFRLRRAIAQEGEQRRVARDLRHDRVDLVERPALLRLGVAGHRARPQPDNGHAPACVDWLLGVEHVADRPAQCVVGSGEVAALWIEQLEPVDGASVDQRMARRGRVGDHLVDAVEIALLEDHRLRTEREEGEQQHGRGREAEANRSPGKGR